MRYFCFDSALNGVYTLMLLQKEYPQHISLFKNTSDEKIWHVAPWIFEIDDANIYDKWKEDPNVSLQRCLIIETPATLNDLNIHLQQFIYKKTDSITHFNRFWDAKILTAQLERFTTKELLAFFEEMETIYIKEENGFLKLSLDKKDRLFKQHISETAFFSNRENKILQTEAASEHEDVKTEAKPRRRFFTG